MSSWVFTLRARSAPGALQPLWDRPFPLAGRLMKGKQPQQEASCQALFPAVCARWPRPFGLLESNTTGRAAEKQQVLTGLEARSPGSGGLHGWVLAGPSPG